MSEPEKVSKEMMKELKHLTILRHRGDDFLDTATRIKENENDEYDNIIEFTRHQLASEEELQAKVLNYVHFGKPRFEAEKTKKYVVRYKKIDCDGDRWYVWLRKVYEIEVVDCHDLLGQATRFDTREEAEKWTNPQTEVVEVEE